MNVGRGIMSLGRWRWRRREREEGWIVVEGDGDDEGEDVDVEAVGGGVDIGDHDHGDEIPFAWSHSGRSGPLNPHLGLTHSKHRPSIAGGGQNLPLEIIRSVSVWLSVLDERGSCPGNALGGMFTCLTQFEDSLAALERILTTPLPFVFSVHIRHTVWIYLFFLPFQLVELFGWYTIPGVTIAAFIYLGFVATGEEIEQPFGYDENDLDLDMFCQEIVHKDYDHLKKTPCLNVFLGSQSELSLALSRLINEGGKGKGGGRGRVEGVFGHHAL